MAAAPVIVPVIVYVHSGNDHTTWQTALVILACALVVFWAICCAIPAWDDARPVGGDNSSILKSFVRHFFTAAWVRELFED